MAKHDDLLAEATKLGLTPDADVTNKQLEDMIAEAKKNPVASGSNESQSTPLTADEIAAKATRAAEEEEAKKKADEDVALKAAADAKAEEEAKIAEDARQAEIEAGKAVLAEKPSVDYGDSVDVVSGTNGKNFVRYYSRELHGDDFLGLAHQLINKPEYATRNYALIPSASVAKLEVRYREKEDAEKHLDDQSPDSPMMDKTRRFEDRDEAHSFAVEKHGAIVIVTK